MFKPTLFNKISCVIITSLLITSITLLTLTSNFFKQAFIRSYTTTSSSILKEVVGELETVNQNIILTMQQYKYSIPLQHYLTGTFSEKELFKLHYDINQSLEDTMQAPFSSLFYTVTLGTNGKLFVPSGRSLDVTVEELEALDITRLSKASPHQVFYTYLDANNKPHSTGKIIAATQLINPYTNQYFGTVYSIIEETTFRNLYLKFIFESNDILLIDSSGHVLSSNNPSLIGSQKKELLPDHTTQSLQTKSLEDVLLLSYYLPHYNMYLVNTIPYDFIFKDYEQLKSLLITIGLMMICLSTLCVFFITLRLTQPLNELILQMRRNSNGQFTKLNKVCTDYEIKQVQYVYNQMIDELDDYIAKLMEEQNKRRQAELATLQMQINPHFLYNTLATIKYLCWQNNTKAITLTINALISLLENTIYQKNEFIPIEKEIENLKHYVTINHIRYGDAITVDYHVESDCSHYLIPKLMLQPFVENSFFHAFQVKKEGRIKVFISKQGSLLNFTILDNGDGITDNGPSSAQTEPTNQKHFTGIGINNVNERIKLIYGPSYGVSLTSTPSIGTEVTILIPISSEMTN